jgi:hypothetical protein
MVEAAEAAEAVETNDTGAQEAHQETEDKALRMGWVPKDQFKGAPEKWTDAETFIKRGEEFLPFLKANNRKLEKALENATADLAEMKKTLKEFGDFHSKTASANTSAPWTRSAPGRPPLRRPATWRACAPPPKRRWS